MARPREFVSWPVRERVKWGARHTSVVPGGGALGATGICTDRSISASISKVLFAVLARLLARLLAVLARLLAALARL
eukprot:2687401-Prymnesium_polylepis.1